MTEKARMVSENPEVHYQIRRKYKTYALVKRLSVGDAEQVVRKAASLRKRRQRRIESVEDFQARL